jgi:hypothetical protein
MGDEEIAMADQEEKSMECDDSTQFIGWWDDVFRPTVELPPVVYHYCSVETFIKIVTSKTMWLTNLFFMNDATEHYWLRDKARKYIDEQTRQHPHDFGYEYLDTILKQEWMQEIYCGCFSERGDLLSQWRAYGGDGTGVAIGVSTSHLQRMCTGLDGHICNVIYEDKQQDDLIQAVFDLPDVQGDEQTIEQGSSMILGRLFEAASRVKSQAFTEEAEWRVVCEPHTSFGEEEPTIWSKARTPKFRDRRGVITPFMEIPFVDGRDYCKRGNEPLKEVIFGPRASPKLQDYAASLMLKQGDFRRVRLLKSTVPYR